MRYVLSAAFWGYMVVSSPLLWLVAVAIRVSTSSFDPRRRVLHRFTCWWAFHYLQIHPLLQVRFEGREHIDDRQPCVFVANHQSLGDILVLFGLARHFKWVSKAVVFKVPFIGWNMRLNDYVALERGNKTSVLAMFAACEQHLRQGSSVAIFAEGTRSHDRELLPFKPGPFRLAITSQVPVVPIVLDGIADALPKSCFVFQNRGKLTVRVHVLEPVPHDAAGLQSNELAKLVRERMRDELARMRASSITQSTSPTDSVPSNRST